MSNGATQVRTSETHPLYINEVVVPTAAAQGALRSLKTQGRIGLTFCPGKRARVSPAPTGTGTCKPIWTRLPRGEQIG